MGTYNNFNNSELWEHMNCGTCHSELWDPSLMREGSRLLTKIIINVIKLN
jgi:hypothetical protein